MSHHLPETRFTKFLIRRRIKGLRKQKISYLFGIQEDPTHWELVQQNDASKLDKCKYCGESTNQPHHRSLVNKSGEPYYLFGCIEWKLSADKKWFVRQNVKIDVHRVFKNPFTRLRCSLDMAIPQGRPYSYFNYITLV